MSFRLFETRLFALPIHGQEQPMAALRRFGHRVWRREGRTDAPPAIVGGRGEPCSTGGLVSYAQGHRIVLARHQRHRLLVLHELAHVLANDPPPYHGPQFLRVYRRLLVNYGGYSSALLKKLLEEHL